MEERKTTVINDEYVRIVPRISYYLKSKNIAAIFKHRCILFAAASNWGIIYLFSNSLEHMGTLCGHQRAINCLCALPNKILASGSYDAIIKIWDIEERTLISTLSGHSEYVITLCYVREGVFVSGSADKSLIIWSKSTPNPTIYSLKLILTGHKSHIRGIIRINDIEIVSGEYYGDLSIWNIDQGLCVRHIPCVGNHLIQMTQHMGGDVVVNYRNMFSYRNIISVWGAYNNWEIPLKEFRDLRDEYLIEFLSGDLLLRGGGEGELEFIDYGEIGCELPPVIQQLHFRDIRGIQRIAKNIVVTASDDGYLKVIDPMVRKCYLKYKKSEGFSSVIYLY